MALISMCRRVSLKSILNTESVKFHFKRFLKNSILKDLEDLWWLHLFLNTLNNKVFRYLYKKVKYMYTFKKNML